MFYTAKSNPRFRVFSVFRGSQSNQKPETRNLTNKKGNKPNETHENPDQGKAIRISGRTPED
jgi:hypothetical protein